MRLIDRLRAASGPSEARSSIPIDQLTALLNAGGGRLSQQGRPSERVSNSFGGYASSIYQAGGPVFAIAAVRTLLFSEARFAFQRRRQGRGQELFTNRDLAVLERPWRGGTTGDLLARMDQDVVLAGNAYVTRTRNGLRRLRPDWVDVLVGTESGGGVNAVDAELVGYLYWPGGDTSPGNAVSLAPGDVAHFAPYPDPLKQFVGMSPLQPVVAEALGHKEAQRHKGHFFTNAATPNLVFTADPSVTPAKLEAFRDLINDRTVGVDNAYRNLFLGGGADVKVVGASFDQLDFKNVQGHSETLIAAALGVHPVIVGLSEGLAGSALNAGNYGQARRRFADGTMRPLWRNAAASLSTLIDVPAGAELVPDVRDVSFLQEDAADAAAIFSTLASAGRQLTDGGFDPSTVVDALDTLDVKKLQHSGLLPVQVQAPGEGADDPPTNVEPAPDDEDGDA